MPSIPLPNQPYPDPTPADPNPAPSHPPLPTETPGPEPVGVPSPVPSERGGELAAGHVEATQASVTVPLRLQKTRSARLPMLLV
jgi:hypothetical protein